jgi:type IV pilus assembly protein PilP
MSDLHDYVARVNARPGTPVEPLCTQVDCDLLAPKVTGVEFEGRGPFDSFVKAPEPPLPPTAMPDPHPTEELEHYALDSLRLLGSVEHAGRRWALLRSPDGVVHRVRAGNYVGRHNGKVIAVYEDRVLLSELVWSDARGWEDREAAIAMAQS